MSTLALIAGSGGLPAALVAALPQRPLVCALDGFQPTALAVDQVFRVERLALFLRHLQDAGITQVAFAGAVQRPRREWHGLPVPVDQVAQKLGQFGVPP